MPDAEIERQDRTSIFREGKCARRKDIGTEQEEDCENDVFLCYFRTHKNEKDG